MQPYDTCFQFRNSSALDFICQLWTWPAALLMVTLALGAFSAQCQSTNASAQIPRRLDEVTVFGTNSIHSVPSESDLVGPANQPEWTARRAFAETDIYVIPQGEIEFNQFYISSHPREGKPENIFESEFAFGLPWRTQFDVELNYKIEGGRLAYDSTRIELPHALADWGKLPLNPALDAGWRFNQGTDDAYFFRLLLAEEFTKRLHFGANFGYERQIGGDLETEYEFNLALSYVVLDKRLTVGAELLVEHETDRDDEEETTALLGPSVLFKPTQNTHLGLIPLFGLTHGSPAAEVFVVFGIDFEPFNWRWLGGKSAHEEMQPVRRSR